MKIANQRQRRRGLLQAVCATAVGAKIKPVVEAIKKRHNSPFLIHLVVPELFLV